MKIPLKSNARRGLTLVELLIILAILAIFAALLLPALTKAKQNHSSPCVNNLKQIGLSFRIWAGDNGDKYPMNISTNDEPAVDESTPVYKYFQPLQNELGTPKIVVCPEDKKRKAATNFINFSNRNVSYFIGLDANEQHPQSILSGDRNITNGFPPQNDILHLTTNDRVEFTGDIHKEQGYILLGDGSVVLTTSKQLNSAIIPNSPFTTNRIKLP